MFHVVTCKRCGMSTDADKQEHGICPSCRGAILSKFFDVMNGWFDRDEHQVIEDGLDGWYLSKWVDGRREAEQERERRAG